MYIIQVRKILMTIVIWKEPVSNDNLTVHSLFNYCKSVVDLTILLQMSLSKSILLTLTAAITVYMIHVHELIEIILSICFCFVLILGKGHVFFLKFYFFSLQNKI